MRVGYFPYKPGGNPFQSLFSEALESAGNEVIRIAPEKWFPLQKLSQHDTDIVQLDWPHDWYRGRNVATAIVKQLMYREGLRRFRKRPVVWTAHNLVAHDAEDVDFEKAMIQKLIDVTDGIIVMSERSKAQLAEVYSVPASTVVKVIPHGHYVDVYENNTDRGTSRKHLGLPQEAKIALSLGRIMPYKGLEELIVAHGEVSEPGSLLVIAGSCSSNAYVEKLKALAAKNTTAQSTIRIDAGFIDDTDLQFYFNAADFIALPFRQILNSGSLMLAMSFGKCVLAPDIGSIREVVCQEGWLSYSADASNGLHQALAKCYQWDGVEQRERQVKAYVLQNYGWESIGKCASDLYQAIS